VLGHLLSWPAAEEVKHVLRLVQSGTVLGHLLSWPAAEEVKHVLRLVQSGTADPEARRNKKRNSSPYKANIITTKQTTSKFRAHFIRQKAA
jgi:hypothetical protein